MIASALEVGPPVPPVSPLEEVWVAFYGLSERNTHKDLEDLVAGLETALLALEESLT